MREKLLVSFKEITSKQKVNRLFKKKLESDYRSIKWVMTRIRDRLKSYLHDLKEKDLAQLKWCTIDQRKAPLMVRMTQQLCVESWRRKITKSTNNGVYEFSLNTQFSNESFKYFLQNIIDLPNITHLVINNTLSDNQADLFAESFASNELKIKKLTITSLDPPLSNNTLLALFKGIGKNEYLEEIKLNYCVMDDAGISSFTQALKEQHSLRSISLNYGFAFSDEGMKYFMNFLAEHPNFKELSLTKYTEEEACALFKHINQTSIIKLSLTNGTITTQCATLVANSLKSNKNLKLLNLFRNTISEHARSKMLPVIKENGLQVYGL